MLSRNRSEPGQVINPSPSLKQLTDYLIGLGAKEVVHTEKSYLAHLIGVYRLMEACGCSEELCLAGMFHSIYGTELFQRFGLPLERRPEIRAFIGERAERLAYLNCAMDRSSLDRVVDQPEGPYLISDRLTGEEVFLGRDDFDDLCRVHLYDWLEQIPRWQRWDYRRDAYQRMARWLGGAALEAYKRVSAQEATSARLPEPAVEIENHL
jgi:hypothetical protein